MEDPALSLIKEGTVPWVVLVPVYRTSRHLVNQLQSAGTSVRHRQLPAEASPCSAAKLGGRDVSTQKWMDNLNNVKGDLLHTHCRLDALICNLSHVSVRGGW